MRKKKGEKKRISFLPSLKEVARIKIEQNNN